MSRLLLILSILGLVLVSGCVQTGNVPADKENGDQTPDPGNGNQAPMDPGPDPPDDTPDEPSGSLSVPETISLCDSLCESDDQAYCSQERTILINDAEVTGTCRAFARQGNVDGFNKCERFCRSFPKTGTVCTVNGQEDDNCDGIA